MKLLRNIQNRIEERRVTRLVRTHTLVGPERIHNLCALAQRIEEERIPGDVIECGVYNGGTAAILARMATRSKMDRTVWLFDSFQGMPQTNEKDGEQAREYVGKVVGRLDQVRKLLQRAEANMSRVKIVAGMFQDTFPKVDIRQIALLNLDCDWYESINLCLEKFYDSVVPGGFVSIYDYGHWPGCREAVDTFFKERSLSYELRHVDYSARWFQKS